MWYVHTQTRYSRVILCPLLVRHRRRRRSLKKEINLPGNPEKMSAFTRRNDMAKRS
jgi:hypothetical protein